ncbi:MAG: nucleotidyltransferase [Clostridium sp.]|nr:nucleotidyltransferase [Clostridium sp.]
MTLVIMAAGMGSRFGGLKQIEPVGPNGEFIIDYSIYDAIKAGFTKVVFIIKEENYEIFKSTIGSRIEGKIDVEYVFQDIKNIPDGVKLPSDRVKPLGTGHAILSCKGVVNEPFAIINADDFYGRDAYHVISKFMKNNNTHDNILRYAMAGYKVKNTLTENGSVKRGVCEEENGYLTNIIECKVEKVDSEIIATPLEGGNSFKVLEDAPVSMNMFAFTKDIFKYLEEGFPLFLDKHKEDIYTCEYLIPSVVFEEIENKIATVEVLKTNAIWQGITYKEDKEKVVKEIKKLVDNNEYPKDLWK